MPTTGSQIGDVNNTKASKRSCWGGVLAIKLTIPFAFCNNEARADSALAYEPAPAAKCCTNWSLNAAAWVAVAC
jgi:hypothetical protein